MDRAQESERSSMFTQERKHRGLRCFPREWATLLAAVDAMGDWIAPPPASSILDVRARANVDFKPSIECGVRSLDRSRVCKLVLTFARASSMHYTDLLLPAGGDR